MSTVSVTEQDKIIITDELRTKLRESQSNELVLRENPSRWVLLPIEFPTLWEYYKRIETSFWTPEDFKWSSEANVLKAAGVGPQNLELLFRLSATYTLVHGLPSPAGKVTSPSHGRSRVAVDNVLFPDFLDLSCEFVESIQTPEGRAYLGFQSMMENFHREVFTKWINVIFELTNVQNQREELNKRLPSIAAEHSELLAKQEWIHTHLKGFHYHGKVKSLAGDQPDFIKNLKETEGNEAVPMAEVFIAFAVMKGIFFSGLYVVPALCGNVEDSAFVKSAGKILNDMFLHGDFAAHLYSSLENKIPLEDVKRLLVQAIELEYNFVMSLLSTAGTPFNSIEFGSLLRHILIRLLKVLGYTDEDDLKLPPCNVPGEAQGVPKGYYIPPLMAFEHKGPFHCLPTELDPIESNATTQAQFTTDEDF